MSTTDQSPAAIAAMITDGELPSPLNGEHHPPQEDQPKKEKNKGGRPPSSGSWIAKLMGSAEKAIIKKRNDDGSLALCGEYSQEDIGRATTMELFIKNYIVPVYGYGKFRVYALRDGNLLDMGQHDVLAPAGVNPHGGSSDPAAAFHAMTDVQIKLQQEAESRATRAKEQAQIEFDNMMKAAAMISGKDKGGMDPMMMMMMMQMMQRQTPQPSHDAGTGAIQALQAAFQTALDQAKGNRDPMPPFPMMMPPSDPGPNIAEIMSTIAQVMKPSGPSAMEQILISLVPTLPGLLAPKEREGFKLTDLMGALPVIIPLIKQMTGADEIGELKSELRAMREGQHKGGIMETLQEFRALREVANEMNPAAPAGESFFQFARDLIQSLPETADAIGDLMLKISASKKDVKRLPAKEPESEPEEETTTLKYPQGFTPYIVRIAESKDDSDYVGNTLKAFQFLGKDDDWKKYLAGMLVRAKGGDKEEVIGFVKSFLEGLRDGGLLDAKACEAASGAFERNVDSVIAWAQGFGRKKNETKPAPTPAPAPAPAPEAKS